MEIFKTVASVPEDPDFPFVLWGSSQTDAAKARKQFKQDFPDADVTTQTVNIPTAKGPLVEWLNANVKG